MGNGMGKIYLEYGCVFDDFPHIWKEENAKCKRVLLDEMQIWNGQGSYYARLDALHMADTGMIRFVESALNCHRTGFCRPDGL